MRRAESEASRGQCKWQPHAVRSHGDRVRTERAGEVVRRLDRPLNIVDVQMLCTGPDGADALVVLTEWNEFRAPSRRTPWPSV